MARGTAWTVEATDDLRVLSVLVEDPLPTDTSHAVMTTALKFRDTDIAVLAA